MLHILVKNVKDRFIPFICEIAQFTSTLTTVPEEMLVQIAN